MFGELDVRRDTDVRSLFYPGGHPPERQSFETLVQPDARTVRFSRVDDRPRIVIYTPGAGDQHGNDATTRALEQRIVYHSPTGLEFGYGGSGPTDTAINVLALVVSAREAVRLSLTFRDEFITPIRRDGDELRLSEVREWIATYYRAELEDSALMRREHEQREALVEIARLDAEVKAAELVEGA